MLRATALSHLADAYQARLDDVVDLLCRENGKVRYEATFEARFIVRALRFASGLALQTFGRVLDPRPGATVHVDTPAGRRRWPDHTVEFTGLSLHQGTRAGIGRRLHRRVKMPSQSAQTAALHAEIISGVPELANGIVNIFTESGSDGARLLVDSPLVPVISFTGSTTTDA